MKVKQLIEKLSKMDLEEEVFCYNIIEEAYSNVLLINEHTKNNCKYCKGNNPFEINEDLEKIVVINGD